MILVKKRIKSRRISIPELDNYIGKDVIISIEEEQNENKLDDFFDCVSNVEIDEDIVEKNRELSLI